jgi:ribosome recycling factor
MSTATIERELDKKCTASLEHLKSELGKMRTGRASTGLLDGVLVEYYGATVPLVQLGLVNSPEPRLLTVQVFDIGAAEAVEKAIREADLGLNPSREGSTVRVPIPPLTEQRRKDLIKKLHKTGEDIKVVVRGLRRDAIDALKKGEKEKLFSEDEVRRSQEGVQKIIDIYGKKIDEIISKKEEDLLQV